MQRMCSALLRATAATRRVGRLAAISAAALLLACGKESPEKMVASARDYLAKGDRPAAVIELKNALQAAPDNAEARLLLGKALLESRDYAGADKELRRALELEQPADAVLPLLARAMSEMGEHAELVKRFGDRNLGDAAAQAEFKTLIGDAQRALAQRAAAADAYAAALRARPDHAQARLGQAALLATEGKADEALAQVDKILATAPKLAPAYALRGALLLNKGDAAGGRQALQAAIDADPLLLPPRLMLAELLLSAGELDEAAKLLDGAPKLAANDMRVTYLQARLAYQRGQLDVARERIQQVLKRLPEHPPSLTLLGAIDLQQGQLVGAEANLRKAVARVPTHPGARQLLARTYLKMKQPAKAREVLQPLLDKGTPANAPLLMLAGETFLANGETARAAEFFDAAAKTDDRQAVPARTRLGAIALATGRADEGFRQLEAAAALDAGQYQADLVIIAAHALRKEYDAALAATRALEKKQPDNPLTYQIFGALYVDKGDTAAARRSFDKALALEPGYLPAARQLALLDLAARRPEEARKRYEAIIAGDSRSEQAYLALADFEVRAGADAKTVAAVLRRAVDANPQSAAAWIALIRLHLRGNDPGAALAAAQGALAALPGDARVLEVAGLAQQAAGEVNQAIDTYNRWAALQPPSATPLVRLGGLYLGRGEHERAIDVLMRARGLEPGAVEPMAELARAHLAARRPDEAMRQVRDLQQQAPKLAAGYTLEGEVFTAQKKLPQAEQAYRQALKLAPGDARAAIGLHRTLVGAGKAAEADAFAAKWIAENPKNPLMLTYLADRDAATGNMRSAAARYRAVVEKRPNDALALNNLAWVAGDLGDPKALDYAERALALAPKHPALADTYGTLLLKKGETDKGIEYLRRASELDPDRYGVRRLKYARELIKAGKKEEARKELRTLRDLPNDFPGKSEIGPLLGSL